MSVNITDGEGKRLARVSLEANVRFGSKAVIPSRSTYVRFAPKADIKGQITPWLKHDLLNAFVAFFAFPKIGELHYFIDRLAGMRSGYDKPGFI